MNHYETLGISKNASQKEIKQAYKNLIKKYHPDIYLGDKAFAEKKTQEINQAYDILSNEDLKKAYDEELNPSHTYDFTPPKYNNPESYSYQNYSNTNYYNSDFEGYKRYTDYHRSKVPNSNYSTRNEHNQFSDNIINSINKLSFNKRIFLIVIILLFYLIFLISSFLSFKSFLDGKTKGTTLNDPTLTSPSKNIPAENTIDENIFNENTINENNIDENTNTQEQQYLDPNYYLSDEYLMPIYEEYFSEDYNSYSEFKEAIQNYLFYNSY